MKDRSLKITSLISSFILISVLLIWVFSKLLAFYRTGSDTLLGGDQQPEVFYAKTHWNTHTGVGRVMEPETLEKITQDYLAALHYLQQHYQQPTKVYYKDYFTEQARLVVAQYTDYYQSTQITPQSSSYEHFIDLELYHMNGSQVVFKDTRLNFDQLTTANQYIFAYDTASYQVMMLLEDNKWRIRHQRKTDNPALIDSINSVNAQGEFIYTKGSNFYLQGKPFASNGINYYPSQNPWHLFWSGYRKEVLSKDFELIKGLGTSVVRIFVPYDEFGGPEVKQDYIQRLQQVLDLAQQHELKVVVTLFDFFLGYDSALWTHSDRHLETLLKQFKNHPAIFAWDIKNEPDLDYEIHGQDEVANWLEFMARRARQYDPNHLVTIGWSDVQYSYHLYDLLDFSSAHFYRNPKQLDQFMSEQSKPSKPFVCGEIGMHTFKSWWYPIGNTKQDQNLFYEEFLEVADKHGLYYWAWTLHDFNKVPPQVAGRYPWQRKPQRRYGLIDANGKPKPAYYTLEAHNTSK